MHFYLYMLEIDITASELQQNIILVKFLKNYQLPYTELVIVLYDSVYNKNIIIS